MSSLPALALLVAATGALRDAVKAAGAEAWVRIEPAPGDMLKLVDEGAAAGASPILVGVFTGDEKQTITDRRWFQGERTVELAVQVLLPPRVRASFNGAVIDLDSHTAGAETAFAAVHRLLEIALSVADRRAAAPVASWAALYQTLVTAAPGEFQGLPFLAATKNGVEVRGADYSLPCVTIPSPAPGDVEVQSEGLWPDLVAKMRTDPDVAPIADFLAALVAGKVLPPWQLEQVLAGLSEAEGDAIGLGTVRGIGAAPTIDTLTITTLRGAIVVGPETDAGA